MITWLVESCEVRRSVKNVGEFDVCLEQKEIETELAMTRNDEEKFKCLEFKVREMLHRACYVEE